MKTSLIAVEINVVSSWDFYVFQLKGLSDIRVALGWQGTNYYVNTNIMCRMQDYSALKVENVEKWDRWFWFLDDEIKSTEVLIHSYASYIQWLSSYSDFFNWGYK